MADQQQQTQPDPFSSADSADSSPVATVRILPVDGVKRSGYVLGKRALKLSTLDRAHRTARESLELVNLNTQAAKETVEAAALISGGLKLLTDATVKTVEALADGATREQKPPTNVWDALKAGAEAIGATMQGDAGRRLIGRIEEAFFNVRFSDALNSVAHFFCDELRSISINHVRDLMHLTLAHQQTDHIHAAFRHAVGEFLNGDRLRNDDLAGDLFLRFVGLSPLHALHEIGRAHV